MNLKTNDKSFAMLIEWIRGAESGKYEIPCYSRSQGFHTDGQGSAQDGFAALNPSCGCWVAAFTAGPGDRINPGETRYSPPGAGRGKIENSLSNSLFSGNRTWGPIELEL
jgi:hypothetical protein